MHVYSRNQMLFLNTDMLLKFVRNKRCYAFVPFIEEMFGNKYDRVEGDIADQIYNTEEAVNISGWQRLRKLFDKHDDDIVHPVVTATVQNSIAGFIAGGLYGALINSRAAFINFIENNEATQFRNHLDAKRKLSDVMFRSYLKGFGNWGTKVCVFVTTFTATQLVLSVYQNKYAFWHYSAGGAAAGALYKFQLGPKGMIAGAVFGGFFGTVYGTLKVILLKLANQTEEDLLQFKQSVKDMKMEFDKGQIKSSETKKIEEELKQAMVNPKAHVHSP